MKYLASFNRENLNFNSLKHLFSVFLQISSIFIVSRGIIIFTLLFFSVGPFALPENTNTLDLSMANNIIFHLKKALSFWDSGWYRNIVDTGYFYEPDNSQAINVAFYYVYPMLSRIVRNILGISTDAALILTSNIATYVSLFLMYYLSKLINISKNAAFIGIILYAVNPFAIFLTAGYSEPIYVLISAITIILLIKKKIITAAFIGGLLSGVRSIGVFFTLILLIYYFLIERKKFTISNILKISLLCIISTWGKVAFMLHNIIRFNEPFASEIVQKYWGNIGGDLTILQKIKNLIKYILTPFLKHFNPLDASVVSILVVYLLLFVSLISIIGIVFRNTGNGKKFLIHVYSRVIDYKVESLLVTWALVQIILPLIIFGMKGNNIFSMGRYVLPMFPLYLLLGNILEKRTLLYSLLLVGFVFEMIILALGFSYGLPRNFYVF